MALSIEQCKQLFNDNYTDEEVMELRDSLSVVVSNIIDNLIAERLEVSQNDINEANTS